MKSRFISIFLALSVLLGTISVSAIATEEGVIDLQRNFNMLEVVAAENQYSISAEGVEYIKNMEGFLQYKINEGSQYTIGYGTACGKDDYPDGITEEEAEELLYKALASFENRLNAFLMNNDILLSQEQYDALVSFTFNVGAGWLGGCRLTRLLQKGSYTAAEFASAFGVWCHVGSAVHSGLITRRVREIQLFLHGDYTGKNSTNYLYVLFDADGGSMDTDIYFFPEGEAYGSLQSASKENCKFLGWYTPDGTQLTEDAIATENLSVTARWRNVTGGTMGNENEITWTYSESTGELSVTGEEIGVTQPVYAAAYDAKGRMIDFALITASGGTEKLNKDADTIKLFWLDAKSAPKCQPGMVK